MFPATNHVGAWLKLVLRFADGREGTRMIIIDALSHSRVKGFNVIIWSDDLEQIQCF